jgi:uncharacterized FlgJ-related protein
MIGMHRRKLSCAATLITAATFAATDANADRIFVYRSLRDVESLFATYRYTSKDWHAGAREVPRIYLDDVPSNWRQTHAARVSVAEKKSLFFRFLAPVVLYVNERILEDRSYAELLLKREATGEALASDDREWLQELALDYEVPGADSKPIDATMGAELLRRVDVIPASLSLAQGAIESGWGTSRFADVGNSLFGQWSWSGGIQPEEQRSDTHGDHRIAAFKTTTLSAAAYAHNLNTHDAYEGFRRQREDLRKRGLYSHGRELAPMMIRYSERGEAYVHELEAIMRHNKLDAADEAMLLPMEIIRLEPGD